MSGIALNAPNPAAINTGATTGAVELTESGGRALKLQTDTPHLVSLGGGRLSTAVTIHPIQQGRTTLGSGPGVDITIQGTGVEPLHCQIENSGGVVTLYPISENLSIDGIPVIHPTRLSQGVMLTIGRSNYMRFNHPAEAQLMKSVLPNSRISMAPITFDTSEDELKFMKKPPIPRKNQREYINDDNEEIPSSIQTKVSKFEYLASQNFKQSISPKVFSANLVTVNTPAKDVLGRAPPDLQDFAKNLQQPACNYSDSLTYNDKQKNNKMSDRYIFGRKSPQYVNVAINNEPKTINNKVAIYENGCIPKQHNVSLNINADQQPKNELNNMNNKCMNNKTLNVSHLNAPSPSFNRNPSPSFNRNPPAYFKCIPSVQTENLCELNRPSEIKNGSDSGFEDIGCMKNDTELRRNQAYAERVREQEIEQAEQARLEEILNMCAEYERQVQWERANKPPTPTRIITNGLLPREKRHCLSSSPFSATASPNQLNSSDSHDGSVFRFDADIVSQNNSSRSNCSYENVSINHPPSGRDTSSRYYYENVELKSGEIPFTNNYENVQIINLNQNNGHVPAQYFPQSPRTRIKTIPICNKDNSSKDSAQLIEKKFAMLTTEQHLLQNHCIENHGTERSPIAKSLSNNRNSEKAIYSTLKKEKRELLAAVATIKRKMAEIQLQEEELNRALEMERALIIGEHEAKLQELCHLEKRKENLVIKAHEIEQKMEDCQVTQTHHQENCRQKLELAQENMNQIETKLSLSTKGSDEYQQLFEEFLLAQEMLDNERKTFEDLEFHHLEEEADWLASREEIQREIVDLSKRIDIITIQVNELEQQKVDTSNSNAQDSKTLERQLLKYSKQLEEYRIKLGNVDAELQLFVKEESDQEVSSDSDSDKRMHNMSYSFIVQSMEPKLNDDVFNMSQSFNEKMLQEKTILECGIGNRCPSQDDIDRISKVTSSAPLNIEDGRRSLGRKTIESLQEIERNRQLHLVQQGSQVIEEERRRVLELKQKAQTEVRAQWAQRQIDSPPLTYAGFEDARNNITGNEELDHKLLEPNSTETDKKIYSEPESPESPRPLSETSDISVEVGGTLGRRRRQLIDKTRPLTRYLPIRSAELDLRQHIETAGHQVVLCPHVIINSVSCRGFLQKRGSKLNGWSRRWFVFDRNKRTLVYYSDKNEKKVRGGAYFQAIEEVYLDHSNSVKSPNPNLTFIIKTHQRYYYLMAPSPEAMRIWIDVVFTGAEGYQEFEHGS